MAALLLLFFCHLNFKFYLKLLISLWLDDVITWSASVLFSELNFRAPSNFPSSFKFSDLNKNKVKHFRAKIFLSCYFPSFFRPKNFLSPYFPSLFQPKNFLSCYFPSLFRPKNFRSPHFPSFPSWKCSFPSSFPS